MIAAAATLGSRALSLTQVGQAVNRRLPCEARTAAQAPLSLFEQPRSTAPGWHLSPANPVLAPLGTPGWETYSLSDVCVERMPDASLAMWYSTAGMLGHGIGLAIDAGGGGDAWTRVGTDPVLMPDDPARFEVGRPSLVRTAAGWRMWYTVAQRHFGPDSEVPASWIETATSTDGRHWDKEGGPVLSPRDTWEGVGLACSNVRVDSASGLYHMWYSAASVDDPEPHAVGLATSPDGIEWTRRPGNPVFTPAQGWEDYLIGSSQVVQVNESFYAFYLGFQRDPYVGAIGMARSRDGVTNWEKHTVNPILAPGRPCTWNASMVYKPAPLWDPAKQRWDVWFNASMLLNREERIGHAWSESIW